MPNPVALVGLTFRGVDLQRADFSLFLEIVEGLSRGVETRGGDWTVGGRPGRLALGQVPDRLVVGLQGWVQGTDKANYRELRRELDLLMRPSLPPGPLVATTEDGVVLTTMARGVNPPIQEGDGDARTREITVDLEAVDPPYWLGVAVADAARAIAASPTDFTMVHPGTERSHRFVATFVGPIDNPRITNLSTDTYVEVLVSVAAGETLVIDGEAFTAEVDGDSVIGSVRHSGARQWLLFDPGDNDLRVTATTPGGTLTTTFDPVYL